MLNAQSSSLGWRYARVAVDNQRANTKFEMRFELKHVPPVAAGLLRQCKFFQPIMGAEIADVQTADTSCNNYIGAGNSIFSEKA